MVRPMVHSKKHYFQTTLSTVTNGAITNQIIAHAKESPTAVNEVVEGSSIKAVYVEYWLIQGTSSIGSFTAGLYKNPGGQNAMVTADAAALGDYDNKKNILYVTQGLSPANTTMQLPVSRGWFKIPKGKQRMGLGDKIHFFIRNNNGADDINFCGFATYKEYV